MKRKASAVFLDRDGVINEILFHREMGLLETPFTVEQFKLKPQAAQAVRRLNRMGLKVVVISNQPGVAMGHFSRATLKRITARMRELLNRQSAHLDGVYYCLHHPTKGRGPLRRACVCRKPKPGLLRLAASELGIDLGSSYFVGDSIFDVQAGQRAGCKTLLLAHLKCDLCQLMARRGIKPDYLVKDLSAAVGVIERFGKRRKPIS